MRLSTDIDNVPATSGVSLSSVAKGFRGQEVFSGLVRRHRSKRGEESRVGLGLVRVGLLPGRAAVSCVGLDWRVADLATRAIEIVLVQETAPRALGL